MSSGCDWYIEIGLIQHKIMPPVRTEKKEKGIQEESRFESYKFSL
jgi:hypothetical protein